MAMVSLYGQTERAALMSVIRDGEDFSELMSSLSQLFTGIVFATYEQVLRVGRNLEEL